MQLTYITFLSRDFSFKFFCLIKNGNNILCSGEVKYVDILFIDIPKAAAAASLLSPKCKNKNTGKNKKALSMKSAGTFGTPFTKRIFIFSKQIIFLKLRNEYILIITTDIIQSNIALIVK